MGFYIPNALKNRAQWVVWRMELRSGQKPDKVPYSPKWRQSNGQPYRASSTNPASWGTFADAMSLYEYGGEYDGLGFVFSASDGLVFVDLDNAIDPDTGEYSALAEEALRRFAGCYAEISQSETGLHIVCYGNVQRAIKRHEVEVYTQGRYMAFTGNAILEAEPQAAQAAIDWLVCEYGQPERVQLRPGNSQIRSTTEAETMTRAERGRNAEEFAALFAGEWQGRFNSQSEADLRLMGLIYWYSYRNDEITLSLFKQSGLAERSKAARRGYLEMTLQRVKNNPTISTSRMAYQRTARNGRDTQPEEKRRRTRKYWNK